MKRSISAFAALSFAIFAFGASENASAQGNPPGVDPEHYQCYTISPTDFRPLPALLRDQFGRKEVRVITPRLLCAPVSKNGATVEDRRSHLVCYSIKEGQTANKLVDVRNQFGQLRFVVQTANLLCVPSLKRVVPPPTAP